MYCRIEYESKETCVDKIQDSLQMSLYELEKRLHQGYEFVSPVQQYRNKQNESEALALRDIIKLLKDYIAFLRSESNYQDNHGNKENRERAYDSYVAVRNFEIKVKDILKDYGIKEFT